MNPTAYVAKRLERLAAEIGAELKRPTIAAHPIGKAIAADLLNCQTLLTMAAGELARTEITASETPAASVSEGENAPTRFVFLAVGRNAEGRDTYAQNADGTVWASAAFGGIACAHRFPTRAAALAVAETRGGHAYPVPA